MPKLKHRVIYGMTVHAAKKYVDVIEDIDQVVFDTYSALGMVVMSTKPKVKPELIKNYCKEIAEKILWMAKRLDQGFAPVDEVKKQLENLK